MKNVKVVVATEMYSRSKHKYQIVFDKTTTLERLECSPFVSPLDLKAVKDLFKKEDHATCTVVAKNMNLPPPESLGTSGTKIVKVKIQN